MTPKRRSVSPQEALLLKRVKKAIAAWVDEPGAKGRSVTALKNETGLSYPTLRRLGNWKDQKDAPGLDTVVRVLEAIGKRLKIVDL